MFRQIIRHTSTIIKAPTEAVPELVKQVASQMKQKAAGIGDRQQDAEIIKDARFEFNQVWKRIENGQPERMILPNEIIWLMGSPASGKGTNTPAILKARGITNPPIVLSRLLDHTTQYRQQIDKGQMIKDSTALEALLQALLNCDPNVGALVDGFPRTEVQVEYLKLLHEKLHELRNTFFGTEHREKFRRPIFRIVVLYVDEEESMQRQLKRGQLVKLHNQRVLASGAASEDLVMERATDADVTLIKARYKIFVQHFKALQRLKTLFPFHLINANGTIEEVMRSIWREFEYQSTQELDQSTYDAIQHIPIANKVGIHARQELVRRLEGYMLKDAVKLKRCVGVIEKLFVPVIMRHAISGSLVIRIDGKQLLVDDSDECVDIVMDILSERGYSVSVDCRDIRVPVRVCPESFKVITEHNKVYVFHLKFPQHTIRGVFGSGDDLTPKVLVGDVSTTETTKNK